MKRRIGKTVILAVNAKYVHSSLAAWVLARSIAHFSRLPWDVSVIEANINQSADEISKRIAAQKPDVIGVCVYIWNAAKLPQLIRLLRTRLPEAVFVLGGPEASHNAEFWLKGFADFVIRGEGERGFPALLDLLAEDLPFECVPGLSWMRNDTVCHNPETYPTDDIIDPYSEEYLASLNGRIAYIETSRGCPFKCAFCLSGGSGVRFFSIDSAKRQIDKLSKTGARTIKFVDRTFNCNAERAYELLEYIIGLDAPCRFHFEVAADLFDKRTLSLLSTAPPGRIQLEAGLQSFFEPALNASCRQTDLKKAQSNIREIVEMGNIHVHLDLIAGLPYEDLPHFQESFNRAYELGAHTLQMGFLKLLHGSALRKLEYGIICAQDPPYEITGSPWLSAEDIGILKRTENALQHTYNKGRFLSSLRYVASAANILPFNLYQMLGEAAPNHGMPLEEYAELLFGCLVKMPGVEKGKLLECMICDWLAMVKGKNMPSFMRTSGTRRRDAKSAAESMLGRRLGRNETAVLPSGKAVAVDSGARDPVTMLYKVISVDIDFSYNLPYTC